MWGGVGLDGLDDGLLFVLFWLRKKRRGGAVDGQDGGLMDNQTVRQTHVTCGSLSHRHHTHKHRNIGYLFIAYLFLRSLKKKA